MACKVYNSKSCLMQCQTYEEALKNGHQCCVHCFNGKHKCSDCHLEKINGR
jgi:cytochrome c peroxidase